MLNPCLIIYSIFLLLLPAHTNASVIHIELSGEVISVDTPISGIAFGVGDAAKISMTIDINAPDSAPEAQVGLYLNSIVSWQLTFGNYNLIVTDPISAFVVRNAGGNSTVEGFGGQIDSSNQQVNDGSLAGAPFAASSFSLSFTATDLFASDSLGQLLNSSAEDRGFLGVPESAMALGFEADMFQFYNAVAAIDAYSIRAIPLPAGAWLLLSALCTLPLAKRVSAATAAT